MDENSDIREFHQYWKNCPESECMSIFADDNEITNLSLKCTEFMGNLEDQLIDRISCVDAVDNETTTNFAHQHRRATMIQNSIRSGTETLKLSNDVKNAERKSLELQKELQNFKAENSSLLTVYRNIVKDYTDSFNYKLHVLKVMGDIYSVEVYFVLNNVVSLSIPMTFNEETKQLIDFDASLFGTADHELLKEWFQTTQNIPGLLCKLRLNMIQHLGQSK